MPGERAGAGPASPRLPRAWLGRSLTNRVTAVALGISLAVALALGGASYVAVRAVLTTASRRISAATRASSRRTSRAR